jgi:small subunit ribosomal protein S5
MQQNQQQRRRKQQVEEEDSGLIERLVYVNRVAKVVKGGRRFSFSAIVVVGDGAGQVGIGHGKANEVPEAIRKATERARKEMITIPLLRRTVPHVVDGHFGAGRVRLRPASAGTGVIAGASVRAIMDCAGVHDVLTKCLGSSNPHNLCRAVMDALRKLESPEQYAIRTGRGVESVVENYEFRDWLDAGLTRPQA